MIADMTTKHDLFDGSDHDLTECKPRSYTVSDALNSFNEAYIAAKCVASQCACRNDQKEIVGRAMSLLAQLDRVIDELEDTRSS